MDAVSKPRWFRLTPGLVLLALLLVVEAFLLLCERFRWFGIIKDKGDGFPEYVTLLIGVGFLVVAGLLLYAWRLPKIRLRWRFQYSLRTLLLVVLLASIGMSWVAVKMQKSRRQRQVVEAIQRLHGNVLYQYQVDLHGDAIPGAKLPVPSWARHLLGEDFFQEVVGVEFSGFDVLDASCLADVKTMTQLQVLSLGWTSVTDADLKGINALRRLQKLELNSTAITDAGLKELTGLTELWCLRLDSTRVTDDGLEHLKVLSGLRQLFLDKTKVTVDGERKLKQALPRCHIWR